MGWSAIQSPELVGESASLLQSSRYLLLTRVDYPSRGSISDPKTQSPSRTTMALRHHHHVYIPQSRCRPIVPTVSASSRMTTGQNDNNKRRQQQKTAITKTTATATQKNQMTKTLSTIAAKATVEKSLLPVKITAPLIPP